MIVPEKLLFGLVRVDPLREIAANKICTLVGRTEAKDLVDLQALMAAGLDLRQALRDAERKDGGVNPTALAFLNGGPAGLAGRGPRRPDPDLGGLS